jgi:hypothetical protein
MDYSRCEAARQGKTAKKPRKMRLRGVPVRNGAALYDILPAQNEWRKKDEQLERDREEI